MATLEDLLRLPQWILLDVDDDGRILLQGNESGSPQLYEVVDGERRRLTDEPNRVSGRYRPGHREAVIVSDAGGNERYQLSRLDLTGGALTPIDHDAEYGHDLADVSPDGRLVAFTSNRRNGVDFDAWVHDLTTGVSRCVYAPGAWLQGGSFSPDGRWLVVEQPGDRPMDTDLVLIELSGHEPRVVAPHADEAAMCTAPGFSPDSGTLWFACNVGRDMIAPARYDLRTGDWCYAAADDDPEHDVTPVVGKDGSVLLGSNVDGSSVCRLVDDGEHSDLPLAAVGVAVGDLLPAPVVTAETVTYTLTGPLRPMSVFRYDRATSTTQLVAGADVPEGLVAPTEEWVTSFDGERVPVRVLRPAGVDAPPVIVSVHGGPEAQATNLFDPAGQALVALGYGVVVPNVRGSTGYGKRYYGLDDTTRRLDSVRDLAAIHDWLGTAGFDPAAAVLYGGSYGGYMVLAGVSMQPERWAAGIDIVGISSLVTFLENTSDYRRPHREREYGSLAHDRDFLTQASPITYVQDIRAPLFIVHGANDPRVPLSEAEQLAAHLDEQGVRHELVVYDDEGHGLSRLANRLDMWPRAVAFLDSVLTQRPRDRQRPRGAEDSGA